MADPPSTTTTSTSPSRPTRVHSQPCAGYTGTDSFTYTVTDGTGKTDTATITITFGPTLIWFIDNAAASNGTAASNSPFNSSPPTNLSAPPKTLRRYLPLHRRGPYTGGFTLLNTQKLIGPGLLLQTETGALADRSDPLPPAGGGADD